MWIKSADVVEGFAPDNENKAKDDKPWAAQKLNQGSNAGQMITCRLQKTISLIITLIQWNNSPSLIPVWRNHAD